MRFPVLILAALTFSTVAAWPASSALGPECPTSTAGVGVTEADLAGARAAYADEPGFVDVWAGGGRFVAVFDAEGRGGAPLPARYALAPGVFVDVVATRFETLLAPPENASDPPLIPGSCFGRISPGARISTPVGGCSLNFIFRDQLNRLYAGTAGHCFGAVGQRMTVGGVGDAGAVVFRVSGGVGTDFALVRIDPEDLQFVNPAMCHWGGPTGIAPGPGGLLRHYGFPVVYSTSPVLQPRTALGQGSGGANSFQASGTAASGDSGSGIRHDNGGAVGVITHVNAGIPVLGWAHSAPFFFGTSVERAMSLAEAGTGLDLTLVTAPEA